MTGFGTGGPAMSEAPWRRSATAPQSHGALLSPYCRITVMAYASWPYGRSILGKRPLAACNICERVQASRKHQKKLLLQIYNCDLLINAIESLVSYNN